MVELNKDYFLFLMDFKDSSKMTGTSFSAMMAGIRELLEKNNRRNEEDFALPLSINYGDEVSGLFAGPKRVYDLILQIREKVHGAGAFRFVVQKGRIAVQTDDITQVGGEVFKRANENMEELKKRDEFSKWDIGDQAMNMALKTMSDISQELFEDLSEYQYGVFRELRLGRLQAAIAQSRGLTPQAVSKSIQRAKMTHIIRCEQSIQQLLESVTF